MLTDSNIGVIWDPDGAALRLVGFGDPMWEEVELDGGQVVQEIRPLRAAGITAQPRGLERHTLRFSLGSIQAGITAADEERFERMLNLPRGRADVLLEFESGTQYRLRRAAVSAWPNGKTGRISELTVEIVGGEYVRDFGTYTALTVWGVQDVLMMDDEELLMDGETITMN